jgi:ethanolamine utilization protein EutQ (cupin superfamily)
MRDDLSWHVAGWPLVTLPYDEALIITRGVFTVRRADGSATAKAGEVIFQRAGAKVTIQDLSAVAEAITAALSRARSTGSQQ